MITVNEIVAELAMTRRIRKRLAKELKKTPKGTLHYKKERGYYRPYIYRGGKEKYLNSDKIELINGLARKKDLQESIDALDGNIATLAHMEENFCNLEDIVPADIKILKTRKTKSELREEFDRWVREKAKSADQNRNIRHCSQELLTSDGVRVRSRAELIIYEFLKSHNVDFVYEKPITIDGVTFHPDFTIRRKSDGMIILWEHFGLMNSDIYSTETRRKIYEYGREGFWPFENLVCTYDFGDGKISIARLEKILAVMGLDGSTD